MNLREAMDVQRKRMGIYGGTSKEILNNAIFTNFESNPAYREVSFNGENIGVHVIENKASTSDNTKFRYIVPKPPASFSVGDLFIDWIGKYWLCLIEDGYHYNKVLARPCNNVLTLQDDDELGIYKIPCILTDKTSVYSDGISDGKQMRLASDQVMTVVPANTVTKRVTNGKRFMFNNSEGLIYKVTRMDKLTDKGLVKIVMQHDRYDATKDNIEKNIASYIEVDDCEPILPPTETVIRIKGSKEVSALIDEEYEAEIYSNGEKVLKDVTFNIEPNYLATILNQGNNKCTIQANKNLEFGNIRLVATLVEDKSVYAEKTILVRGL